MWYIESSLDGESWKFHDDFHYRGMALVCFEMLKEINPSKRFRMIEIENGPCVCR